MRQLLFVGAAPLLPQAASAQAPQPKVDPALVERYVAATWKGTSDEWKARVQQDETQRVCSETGNSPQGASFDQMMAREQATVVLPADGNVIGDWKKGQRVAQVGTGGQFSDNERTARGGNCYACHQMAPAEVSFGTLGPSLTGYGKLRQFDKEEAKKAFVKIYNAMAVVPCSQMPRFGRHKFLTEEQIKDAVAYLFDPQSPVNK